MVVTSGQLKYIWQDSIEYTAYSTPYSTQYTVYSTQYTQYIVYSTQYRALYMVWYVSVSGASSHSLMPGPACPNARPGRCPDCRAQTRGAQQSITRTTCAQFSRGSERGDSPVVGDHRELRVRYKSDTKSESSSHRRDSPHEVTIPLVTPCHPTPDVCYGSL